MFSAKHLKALKPAAKERQKQHGGTAPGKKKNTFGNVVVVFRTAGLLKLSASAEVCLTALMMVLLCR